MNIDIYKNQENEFPLIASVLEGVQEGQIFRNSENNPTHFFVINKFGFCQDFYTDFDRNFFESIKKFIQERNYKKLRYYAPSMCLEKFLDTIEYVQKCERIQFELSSVPNNFPVNLKYQIERINIKNIKSIDFGLDLANRYWKCEHDFVENAMGFVALSNSKPVGCCYSAANALNKAEIDIFVDERYRKEGLGYALGVTFINECLIKAFKPSWDCYSNNTSSINLAKKLGFSESLKYSFYNVNGSVK